MKPVLKALAALVALGLVLGAVVFVWIGSRGISARAEPGRLETLVARTMRGLAIPRRERNTKNPVAVTPEVLAAGMAHWADHCAACHGNDGRGETEIGLGLYPKPPDMRLPATQGMSDGELFHIIENGVRLTGMPAWGNDDPTDAEGTWHLVHFIRRLPTLTPDEVTQMQGLNPKSPDGIRGRDDAHGGEAAPAPPSHTEHK